jgi:hypothetical protein
LQTALRTRQSAEQAANPLDHRVHYAVEPLVNGADEMRRQAEDIFYLGSDARRFDSLTSEAQGDAGRTTGYLGTIQIGQKLGENLRLRDEIFADLPLLAEWHFARGRLSSTPSATQLLQSLFERAIELDDGVERTLRSRDEPGTFAARYVSCERAYDALSQTWRNARAELESIYELPTNIERAYRRAPDVRDAELALRFPPLVGSSNQFLERYQQTLAEWVTPEAGAETTSRTGSPGTNSNKNDGKSPLPRPTSETSSPASTSGEYAFLRELHRALAYEFVDPYDQHRHATQWDEKQNADLVFRSADALQESAWNRLKTLLDRYNEAIAKQSPSWSGTQRSLAASATLRQWDRRVRVAGPWLCSFQNDLRRPNQPTPARWLQQYDAAHLTAWHAYRVKGDFWGNGMPGATAAPFFAEAIEQCDAALPERMRPIQYDLPGSGGADFAEERPAALAALGQWDPLQFPRSLNVSSEPSAETKIDVAVQPLGEGSKELKLPPGVATLSFAGADGISAAPRVAFDSTREVRRQAVSLPLAGTVPVTFAAYLDRQTGGPSSTSVEARLWYRGHVRTKPCPADNSPPFVKYEFNRPRYAPPTVEVRGKDVVRGAVLFIFDCSASMRDADGRFAEAKRQLQQVLDQLAADAGPGLRVGLVAYGKRTKAFGSEEDADLFYRFRSHPDRTPQLTRAGEAMKERLGGRFFEAYPHPDRDVEELVRVAEGTPVSAKAKLNDLREAQCVGCTPLYYTIAQAIQNGFRGLSDQTPGSRQIVVISDGVNMPYNCAYDERTRNYSVGQTGANVNNDDYAALERVLDASQGSVRVTVHLFGAPGTDFEREQYLTLKRLDGRQDSLDVVNLPNAARIKESILDSFPKSKIELRVPSSSVAAQPLAFNQAIEVKDWGNDGLVRREAERRSVRLKLPGEERSLEQELELLGGERVVLQYNSRDAQLAFDDDGLTRRGSGQAQAPRGPDSRKLLFDALDPERIGPTINRFHFRIRDEERDRRFTPRPKYVWLELSPRGVGGDATDVVFPCIDTAWKENTNLPRLQMPVERWPDCPSARVRAWFRYSDPISLHLTTITRDQGGQTLGLAPDKWRVEQMGGEAGAARTITVTWQPSEPQAGMEKLLERAVWLWPPPDITRRFYALDGSAAIHEFTYSRPEAINLDLQLRVVSRTQFQQGAYFAECEFDVAN